jgi:hypothetical protein
MFERFSLGLERIVGAALRENKASLPVVEKLGIRYEATPVHRGFQVPLYAIEKEESSAWERRQAMDVHRTFHVEHCHSHTERGLPVSRGTSVLDDGQGVFVPRETDWSSLV